MDAGEGVQQVQLRRSCPRRRRSAAAIPSAPSAAQPPVRQGWGCACLVCPPQAPPGVAA